MALRVASALSTSLRARAPAFGAPAAAWRAASRRPAAAFFSTKYTKQHEYISLDGKIGTIGITDFAQNSLGDVVYVDLPSVGDYFKKGYVCQWLFYSDPVASIRALTPIRVLVRSPFGAVESVKAASDVYVPASGKVTAVNEVRRASLELGAISCNETKAERWSCVVGPEREPAPCQRRGDD